MYEWTGESNYGTQLRIEAFIGDEIYLGVGQDGGYLSSKSAKDLRKALKKAIKKIEG